MAGEDKVQGIHEVEWTEEKAKCVWEAYNVLYGTEATGVYPPDFYQVVLGLVGNNMRPGGRCLDVGCGPGVLAELLDDQSHPVAVIDFAPANIERLKDQWGRRSRSIEARVGRLDAIPYPDESFDTVFATEVLEHLSIGKLSAGLREVRRVLVPGGIFVATTPYAERLDKIICPECLAAFHPMGHVQSVDERMAARILEEGGLAPILIKRFPTIFVGRNDGILIATVKRLLRWSLYGLCARLRGHNLIFVGRKV